MRNSSPIFVNGFSRGGSTILTNLLASHPEVCLIGETHHAFKGHSITDSVWGIVRKCLYHDAPILAGQCQDFFSPRLIAERKPLSRWAKSRVDQILYAEKFRSQHPTFNQFKAPDQEFDAEEIEASRLLGMNIDGIVFANDAFVDMYPEATFYGVVRNGLAVCEGHVRRGQSPREVGERYQKLVDKMCDDAHQLARYEIFRFEDILNQPIETLNRVFLHAGLEISKLDKIRVHTRRVMDAHGNHRLRKGKYEWELAWISLDQLEDYLDRNVDANQAKLLSYSDRNEFLRYAGAAMERLGYSTSFGKQQTTSEQSRQGAATSRHAA
ncbi:MAG: sulfotransferase [Planctomycetales bacterium]|nr:sulfotransferase [Planctomycetales bacterium]